MVSTEEASSESTFHECWTKEFPHVKIMTHDVFSRCNTCTSLTSIIQNSKDPVERARALKAREIHWQRVTKERRVVEAARYRSRHDEDFFFCEIDGMDSAKTILPHFSQWSKDVDKKKLLKVHLSCVKYDGSRPDDIYYYTDCFPHDSANTISVMHKTLLKVSPLWWSGGKLKL